MTAPAELAPHGGTTARDAGVWAFAAAAAVLAHVAVIVVLHLHAERPPKAAAEAEQAMVVELAPLPVVSSAAASSGIITEAVPVEEAAPEEPLEPVPDEIAEAALEDDTEPMEPATTPAEQAASESVPPAADTIDAASSAGAGPEPMEEPRDPPVEEVIERESIAPVEPEVVVPMARPDPVVVDTPAEKPPARAEPRPKRKVEKKPERQAESRKAQTAQATRKAETRTKAASKADASVASRATRSPVVSPSRWNSQVRAAIARRVGGCQAWSGRVRVRFVVSRSGAVTSVRIAASLGQSAARRGCPADGALGAGPASAGRPARVRAFVPDPAVVSVKARRPHQADDVGTPQGVRTFRSMCRIRSPAAVRRRGGAGQNRKDRLMSTSELRPRPSLSQVVAETSQTRPSIVRSRRPRPSSNRE
jgi:protein TonB